MEYSLNFRQLDYSFNAKIGDLSIVKVIGSQMSSNIHSSMSPITSRYASPEQLKGEENSEETSMDVYSFAVLFWELIAERTPYEGLSLPEIIRKVTNFETPEINVLENMISPDMVK